MKLIKRARHSLIFSCAVYFALFTLIIVLLYTAFQWVSNQMLSESVFTMYDLMSYEEELRQEDYAQIPAHNSKNSAIIIFDEKGSIQYASNDTIADLVNKGKDLEKIVLSRAVQKHIERKVLVYKNKTVIFS